MSELAQAQKESIDKGNNLIIDIFETKLRTKKGEYLDKIKKIELFCRSRVGGEALFSTSPCLCIYSRGGVENETQMQQNGLKR